MKQYVDNDYIAYSDTLLACRSQIGELTLPARLGGSPIRTIGSGSCSRLDAHTIRVPQGIEHLESECFSGCTNLLRLYLPGSLRTVSSRVLSNCKNLTHIHLDGMKLEPSRLSVMDANSIPLSDGSRLCRRFPDVRLLTDLVACYGIGSSTCCVPEDMQVLFRAEGDDLTRTPLQLRRSGRIRSEQEEFVAGLSYGFPSPGDSEAINDRRLREDGPKAIMTKVILCQYRRRGELVDVTLLCGQFFWQSNMPVVWNDRTYQVYRRYFLEWDGGYYRRDMTIFDGHRPVTNRETMKYVLSKYLLPILL